MNECPCVGCQVHQQMPPLRPDRRAIVVEVVVGVVGVVAAVLLALAVVIV